MNAILILDADFRVAKFIRHVLRDYTVFYTTTAIDALRTFREHRRNIGLLIADVTSPELSGIQVALLLRIENPNLAVILTSGFPVSGWSKGDSSDLERLGENTVTIVQKPFEPGLLLEGLLRSASASNWSATT